ncbi:uncharacterized protein KD926_002722 [Aspergillus affinis]|uniref:uncharacterized protein n=1 Tax=Aspergillus affinis TaxID=1070780 RepID=UPI0022FEC3D2|nr:uncharacterized protein KD926_002722 [Aspergillus affinis]KAI9043832.1 hypothetical protein KD926_002722 [Aspergillus affinis]
MPPPSNPKPKPESNTLPTHIPASHTTNTPPESFPPPENHGDITWHTLISAPQTQTSDLSAGIAVCPPRTGHLCAHRHTQAEIYHILDGEGEMIIEGRKFVVGKGSTVFIPGDAEHGIANVGGGDLRWFYVFPTGSFGDVVYWFSEGGGIGNGKREKGKL